MDCAWPLYSWRGHLFNLFDRRPIQSQSLARLDLAQLFLSAQYSYKRYSIQDVSLQLRAKEMARCQKTKFASIQN